MPGDRTGYLRATRECPDYEWWRMPVATIAGIAAYIGFSMALFIYLGIFSVSIDSDIFDVIFETTELSTSNYWVLGFLLLTVAYMLPAAQLGRAFLVQRAGDLWSVAGRLRWRWLGVMSGVAFVLYTLVIGAAIAVDDAPVNVSITGEVIADIVMLLPVVPFQATAEEVVFRGQLMQMIGNWTRWAWIPVLVTTLLFVAGHTYNWIGLVDVGIFGLTAAILVIRTGGLEAAMAAHTANNVVVIAAEMMGAFDSAGEMGPLDWIPTIITSAIMIIAAELLMKPMGVQRTRERLPDPVKPVLPVMPQPVYYPGWPPPGSYPPPAPMYPVYPPPPPPQTRQ